MRNSYPIVPLLFTISLLFLFSQQSIAQEKCSKVMSTADNRSTTFKDLRELDGLVTLIQESGIDTATLPWVEILDHYINPALRPDTPFVAAALVGRSNVGRTTLFNALPTLLSESENLEIGTVPPIGLTDIGPGTTRRLTILAGDQLGPDPLTQRFGAIKPWQDPRDSSTEGSPIYLLSKDMPKNVVFIDTPGIESLETNSERGTSVLMRPFSAIRSAEVLVFIFSRHDIGDYNHISKLQDALKTWGLRKLILVFNIDPSISAERALEEVEKVGRHFEPNFDISKVGSAATSIIGTYLLPENPQVFQGLRHAELKPLGNSLEFPSLVRALDKNVEAVWENVFKDSIRSIARGAHVQLLDITKNMMELTLLRETVALMVQDSAQLVVEEFPYAEMRNTLQEYWRQGDSEMGQSLRNMSDMTARPERYFITNRFRSRHSSVADRRVSRFRPQQTNNTTSAEELRIRSALDRLVRELSEGEIILSPEFASAPERSTSIENIKEAGRDLNRINPEVSYVKELPDGGLEIRLGDYNNYRQEIINAIRSVLNDGLNSHVEPIMASLQQLRPPLAERETANLVDYVQEVKENQSGTARAMDRILPHLHWLLPGGVMTAELYTHYMVNGLSFGFLLNPLTYLIPANVAARIAYGIDRNYVDRTLVPATQKWSSDQQKAVFTQYVNSNIIGPLVAEIAREESHLGINKRSAGRYMRLISDLMEGTGNTPPLSLTELSDRESTPP